MQIEILDGEIVIGTSILDGLDPPMGCASGRLLPTEAYDPERHATTVSDFSGDRQINDQFRLKLQIRDPRGETVECLSICIADCMVVLGEIEIDVIGIPAAEYTTYFGNHPEYLNYFE